VKRNAAENRPSQITGIEIIERRTEQEYREVIFENNW